MDESFNLESSVETDTYVFAMSIDAVVIDRCWLVGYYLRSGLSEPSKIHQFKCFLFSAYNINGYDFFF